METPTNPRKRARKNPNQPNPDLSVDLQLEILSLLPAKSVLRFRSVCKLWNAETRENRFVDKQLLVHKNLQNHTFGFQIRGDLTAFNICDLKSSGMVPQPFVPAEPFPLEKFWVYSSCDGLLCLSCGGKRNYVCLTNPVNRDYVLLPNLSYSVGNNYGLGYDSIAKEYKVVTVMCQVLFVCRVTLADGPKQWKVISNFPYQVKHNAWVFVEGRLHCLVRCFSGNFPFSIMSFDLHDEKLRELQLDNKIKEWVAKAKACGKLSEWDMMLMVLNGRLAVFMSCQGHKTVSLWVMEECGKEESWIMVAFFTFSTKLQRRKYYNLPLCVLYLKDDKKILLCYKDKIFSYDMKKKKCVELKEEPDKVPPYYGVTKCVPFVSSLVKFKDARTDWENIRSLI